MTATSTETAMPTTESLKAALDSLGRTPQEIAAALVKQGHRGMRAHTLMCPLAVFIRATFTASDAVVGRGYAFSGPEAEVPLSEALAQFVVDFDQGAWYTRRLDMKGSTA